MGLDLAASGRSMSVLSDNMGFSLAIQELFQLATYDTATLTAGFPFSPPIPYLYSRYSLYSRLHGRVCQRFLTSSASSPPSLALSSPLRSIIVSSSEIKDHQIVKPQSLSCFAELLVPPRVGTLSF